MTHDNDRSMRPRGGVPSDKIFVLSGLVALGVILAIFMFTGRDSPTTTAMNGASTIGAGSPPVSR